MPAPKPQSLNNRHSTKEEIATRTESESAMLPSTPLTLKPPAVLTGHKVASDTWKRLRKLYGQTEGHLATAFDEDLLAKYCLLEEECFTLEDIRDDTLAEHKTIAKQLKGRKPKADEVKGYLAMLEQNNALLARYQGLDARLDGKRKLLHALAQSLYLTPRSRAGVDPKRKDEKPPDAFNKEFD